MKLIIDIPDKVYNEYREGVMSMENNCIIGNAVFDGKPYEERSQGEWVYLPTDGKYKCPKCDNTCKCDTFPVFRYCPWCGSDNLGDDE